MELLQLTYFCHAAETENFSETAKKYGVPASNISQSVHRLEKELGIVFFDRSANKIKLNEQGRILYKDAKKALDLLNHAKKSLRENDEISGEIKILAETNRRVVIDAVDAFQREFKDVSFFINHSAEADIYNYDFIITDKNIVNKNLKKELLVVDDILLAIEKNNPLARKTNITLEELENERFITMNNTASLYRLTNEICKEAGYIPNIVVQSDDPYYVRKYVEMGMGISFVPSSSWKGLFSENVVLKKVVNIKRNTYIYSNMQKYRGKAAELFERIIRTEYKRAAD